MWSGHLTTDLTHLSHEAFSTDDRFCARTFSTDYLEEKIRRPQSANRNPSMAQEKEVIKIIVVGDAGTGKTSIIKR